jgi:hypothetical protein
MYGFMAINKDDKYYEDQIYISNTNNFEFYTNPRDIEFIYSISDSSIFYVLVEILGNIIYSNPTFFTDKIKLVKILSKNGFTLFLNNIKNIPNYEHITPNHNIYQFVNGKLHSENDLPAIQEIDKFGIKYNYWYYNGILHRSDRPAIESSDGMKIYYYYGIKHRIDGPAIITKFGDRIWYSNGFLHRINGPAIQWKNGTNEWYFNGNLHNSNGPAIIFVNGTRKWYYENKLHRVDGPAIIYSDGYKEWYQDGLFSHGEEYNYDTENEFNLQNTDCSVCTDIDNTKINKKFSIFNLFE